MSSRVKPCEEARDRNSWQIWSRIRRRSTSSCSTGFVPDERAGAHVGLHEAGELELGVGAAHRVGVDGEVDRELAHRRQAVAGPDRARGDGALHLVDDLPVDRHAALQVDRDREGHRSTPWRRIGVFQCSCTGTLLYQYDNTLVLRNVKGAQSGGGVRESGIGRPLRAFPARPARVGYPSNADAARHRRRRRVPCRRSCPPSPRACRSAGDSLTARSSSSCWPGRSPALAPTSRASATSTSGIWPPIRTSPGIPPRPFSSPGLPAGRR